MKIRTALTLGIWPWFLQRREFTQNTVVAEVEMPMNIDARRSSSSMQSSSTRRSRNLTRRSKLRRIVRKLTGIAEQRFARQERPQPPPVMDRFGSTIRLLGRGFLEDD